jgi:hypothetical protein
MVMTPGPFGTPKGQTLDDEWLPQGLHLRPHEDLEGGSCSRPALVLPKVQKAATVPVENGHPEVV